MPSSGNGQCTSRGRVLLVDDDGDVRLFCRINLELSGYAVDETSSRAGLLELGRASRPDLILLDLLMPEGGGWECLLALDAEPALVDVPVVIMSASDSIEIRARGDAAAVRGYLTKPFHPQALLALVDEFLDQHRRVEKAS